MINATYLIIGAGPAGASAVRGIRQSDKESEIVVVGKESERTYSLPLLSKGYIQGRYPKEKLYLVKEDFFENNNARFINGTGAKSIDCSEKTVELENRKTIKYEKLLLATGASPRTFDVPVGTRGIYYLRTLGDADQIIKAAGTGKSAIVIGGSFIGVELACALKEIGVGVKLLMLEDYVFQTLLPEEFGMSLNDILIDHGVEVIANASVDELVIEGGVARGIRTIDGQSCSADFICAGIGVVLNIGYLGGSGVSVNKGVLVNRYLETSVEGVYAAGDLAEYEDIVLGRTHMVGHIESAQAQGRQAGNNMAGAKEAYAQVTGYDTEIFGDRLIFLGDLNYAEKYVTRGDTLGKTGCIGLRDGKIVGVYLINPKGKDMRGARELFGLTVEQTGQVIDELKNPEAGILSVVKSLE